MSPYTQSILNHPADTISLALSNALVLDGVSARLIHEKFSYFPGEKNVASSLCSFDIVEEDIADLDYGVGKHRNWDSNGPLVEEAS
mmetsp:Transcript_2150/g.3115  ORF Transcript_2150/g.3115 Transcript_2150/m.3115 type:complete len:86 (+) Transcript_2150:88-345(+)